MIPPRTAARRWVLLTGAALSSFVARTPASAQKRPAQEFTQQGILVANFSVLGDDAKPLLQRADLRAGRHAGDVVRDRLAHLVQKREAMVISGQELRASLIAAEFPEDSVFSLHDLWQHGRHFRVDELVVGTVQRTRTGVRLGADLVLHRDIRMRQPIAPVAAVDVDRAADTIAARVIRMRGQLRSERRCENALRDGQGTRAIQAAREGVNQYRDGALVRTCLIWALRATGAPAGQILAEAGEVLAIDSAAPHAIEASAVALDSLHRRSEAADMWFRLVATDSANLELVERVLFSLAEGGNSRRAEPLVVRVSNEHPDDLRFVRQKWRIANDNRNWPLAVSAGETLLINDDAASRDSVFFLRLATAYRMNGQPLKAVETVARGVSTFPKDPHLYALYTQFVKEEGDTVIGRGLALFPSSAELLALNAKDLRAKGRVAEALDASKRAVELDSTIDQGHLLVAQTEMELGRPDSALATLHRAVVAGEDVSAVAAMTLSKGNILFRAANMTKTRADFQLAMRFLAFADSLKSTAQSKFLLGAAALGVAQMALTDAPKIAVKDEACVVSHLGADTIPIARASLSAGQDVSPDATKQFLEYLDQITPYADKQIAAFCTSQALPKGRGAGGAQPAQIPRR